MSTVDVEPAPPFPVERPAYRPWREGAVTRANELETLRRWLHGRHDHPGQATELSSAVHQHLEIARGTASGGGSPWRTMTGASLQRTASNLDAAEATLLRLAPTGYLEGQLPGLLTHVRRYLPLHDARREQLEALVARRQKKKRNLDGTRQLSLRGRRAPQQVPDEFSEEERGIIVTAVRGASSEEARVLMQAQSFRNTLVATAVILVLLAATATVLSIASPATVPLCFVPESGDRVTVVCPTAQESVATAGAQITGTTPSEAADRTMRRTAGRWDLLTVEALGLASAAISAAVALRKVRGSSTLAIPIALAVLKLPLGAFTAVLGILLMRGGFVPGLSALDSSAQILAWAVIFGYAQQTFTRLIDQQASVVLDTVKRPPSTEVAAAATGAATPTGRRRRSAGASG
jgi:hypothetical protein